MAGREVSPAGPLPVRILPGEQAGSESLGGNAAAGLLPHFGRGTGEVPLHLPAQGRVRIQEPVKQGGVDGHGGEATSSRCGGPWPDTSSDGQGAPASHSA